MSCSKTQRSDTGEARTRGLSVSSQALYHRATALPGYLVTKLRSLMPMLFTRCVIKGLHYYYKVKHFPLMSIAHCKNVVKSAA